MEEDEVLKYVEGKKVSNSFLDRLEKDLELQRKVTLLKDDLMLMDRLNDSSMFHSIKEKPRIVIKNNSVIEYAFFTFVTPLTVRSVNEIKNKTEEKKDNIIYSYKNIEVTIIDGKTLLYINKIKNILKIYKDKKIILNIEANYDNYSIVLKKGNYVVEVDSYTSDIVVL